MVERSALPFTRLGPYVIERELGRGGMGAVYLARGPDGGARAIKVPLFQGPRSDERRARFEREALALSRLSHPGIVRLDGLAAQGSVLYCVFELVDGEPLDATLARGPLPVDRALEIAEAIGRALAHAHERGVVHRDVKPSNVIVRRDGSPVLMDFGLARDDQQESLTRTGAMLGTPDYMSPEQMGHARHADHRSDVYGLGAVLHELLTGQPPFTGDSHMEVFAKIASTPAEPPSTKRDGIAPDVDAIVLRALEKEPDARYASALDFADDLARARRGERIAASPRPVRGRAAVAVGLVAVAAVACAFVVASSGRTAASTAAPAAEDPAARARAERDAAARAIAEAARERGRHHAQRAADAARRLSADECALELASLQREDPPSARAGIEAAVRAALASSKTSTPRAILPVLERCWARDPLAFASRDLAAPLLVLVESAYDSGSVPDTARLYEMACVADRDAALPMRVLAGVAGLAHMNLAMRASGRAADDETVDLELAIVRVGENPKVVLDQGAAPPRLEEALERRRTFTPNDWAIDLAESWRTSEHARGVALATRAIECPWITPRALASAYGLRADHYESLGKTALEKADLEKALAELHCKPESLEMRLADIALNEGRWEDAVALGDRAVTHADERVEKTQRGFEALSEGRPGSRPLSPTGTSPGGVRGKARALRAKTYVCAGKLDEARADIDMTIELLGHNNKEALIALAQSLEGHANELDRLHLPARARVARELAAKVKEAAKVAR